MSVARGNRYEPQAAATRWEYRSGARGAAVDIDDDELLACVRSLARDGDDLQLPQFRRRYEREWLAPDEAIRRVLSERAEVMGARIATFVAAAVTAPIVLFAVKGTVLQSFALATALVVAGFAVVKRGPSGLVRATVIQCVAIGAILFERSGLLAGFAGLYVPALAMSTAAWLGARVGALVSPRVSRPVRRQLEEAYAPASESQTRKAIAA